MDDVRTQARGSRKKKAAAGDEGGVRTQRRLPRRRMLRWWREWVGRLRVGGALRASLIPAHPCSMFCCSQPCLAEFHAGASA